MANKITINEVEIGVGDLIRVHYGEFNPFEGILIGIKGTAEKQTVTVRRIGVGGTGIEKIFPLVSPLFKKIEIKKKGRVRRAKLYYLRTQTKKELKKLTRDVVKKQPSKQSKSK